MFADASVEFVGDFGPLESETQRRVEQATARAGRALDDGMREATRSAGRRAARELGDSLGTVTDSARRTGRDARPLGA